MITLDSETYFWTFSTIAQSMAALIAVTGMFIIFRLQLIMNKIEEWLDTIRNNNNLPYDYELREISEFLDEKIEEGKETPGAYVAYEKFRNSLNRLIEKRDFVVSYIRQPMFLMSIIFIISIFTLPFCKNGLIYKGIDYKLFLLGVSFLLIIWMIIVTCRAIIRSLQI